MDPTSTSTGDSKDNETHTSSGGGPSDGAWEDTKQAVEDKMREAAYTAVGVAVFAYKYSEPRVKRAAEAAERWQDEHRPDLAGDFQKRSGQVTEALTPVRSWIERCAAEGRSRVGR